MAQPVNARSRIRDPAPFHLRHTIKFHCSPKKMTTEKIVKETFVIWTYRNIFWWRAIEYHVACHDVRLISWHSRGETSEHCQHDPCTCYLKTSGTQRSTSSLHFKLPNLCKAFRNFSSHIISVASEALLSNGSMAHVFLWPWENGLFVIQTYHPGRKTLPSCRSLSFTLKSWRQHFFFFCYWKIMQVPWKSAVGYQVGSCTPPNKKPNKKGRKSWPRCRA